MLRRILVVAIAACSFLSLAVPAEAAITSDEREGTNLINASRRANSRSALRIADGLAWVARQHSCAMARSQYLRHRPRINANIARWNYLGENVGVGGNLRELQAAFMASPTHRRNVVGRQFREVGVGVCRDRYGHYWITQIYRG